MRMVATDLDGTIVRPDLTVSERTVAALRACVERGVELVFVTGRPPRWLAPVAEATGHLGSAICANGAVIYDLVQERVLTAHTLSATRVLTAVERARDALGAVDVALETTQGFMREPSYRARWDMLPAPEGDVRDLVHVAPVVKLLLRAEHSTADRMLAALGPVLDGIAEPTHSNPYGCLIEVSAPGVNKASTLAGFAEERGIAPQDVVAFGDMPNDLAMLRWAGTAYAMAGGHPDVVRTAGQVAPSCVDDGVAQILEEKLTQRSWS